MLEGCGYLQGRGGTLNDQPAKVVDARELHKALESRRDFSSWINYRANQLGFQEGVDYIVWSPNLGSNMAGGWNRKEYRLSLDMAKHLCMMERTEAGPGPPWAWAAWAWWLLLLLVGLPASPWG